MFCFLKLCFGTLVRFFRSRHSLLLETLALRQQLVVLKRRHPRPKLGLSDKLFWLLVRRCVSGWKQALLVVTPETVVRDLIFQMVAENPDWGAPRIHGELLMLGLMFPIEPFPAG